MELKFDQPKPLILVFPFDLLSHYLRCVELAKYLRKDFELRFVHSPTYDRFVVEHRFKTFFCKNFNAAEVMKCAQRFDFSWLNSENLENIFEDQVRSIREFDPVIVLGDVSPTLKMAAEKTNVKYVSLVNGYMSKFYAHVRKIPRVHPAYKYSKKLPENVFDFITKTAEALAFRKVHKPFKSIRKKHHLSSKKNYLDELEGALNLVCDLEDVFPQRNLPSNYKIISPLFHTSNIPFTGLIDNLDKSKKTIFVSMGSSGDWNKVEFLNDVYFSKYNIVSAADEAHVLKADHILKVSFSNVDEFFPMTDLVICHGGNGTVYQALSHGIPVLFKTTLFEQEWNAYGFEKSGFGYALTDVHSDEEIKAIIDVWINKKNSGMFENVKDKIKSEKLLLETSRVSDAIKKLIEN